MKHLLALWAKRNEVGVEFFPQSSVVVSSPSHSDNTACLQYRVERRKIAELDCKTARRSAHLCSDLFDYWVVSVKFSKGKFAVEIQRDEPMLSRPRDAGCFRHAAIVV